MSQKKRILAQVSIEYLTVSAFALIIVTIIFGIALAMTSQNIKTQQTSESLNNLVNTADLIYAMGPGNMLFAEVIWPNEVTSIDVLYKCKENSELRGCPGEQAETCNCTIGGSSDCQKNEECIKYSAIQVEYLGSAPLIYPSKAKLMKESDLLVNGVKYKIMVSWTDTEFVQLKKEE